MRHLQVTGSDLLVNQNKTAHNASSFIGNQMIVRRGQEVHFKLKFNRSVKAQDTLQFTSSLVTNAGSSLLQYNFSDSGSLSSGWGAKRQSSDSNSTTIALFTPVNAVIGRYSLSVQTSGGNTPVGNFVLLFNPWAKDDAVFMANQAEREEYVLSEFGLIYMGEPNNPNGSPWDYGQFQDNILNICLNLLDSTLSFRSNALADVQKRNDPGHVCRVLSSIINSNDDNGVVIGDWSGDYSEGTDPNTWTGSGKILRSWFEQKQSVKFGQCWVFAGVACTVSRALGLPCRVITNFASAHDSDNSLEIENYYNVSGELAERSNDSIWNFHCWNESWFWRSDLGQKYGGWQIWDSTPQEKSNGIYQLGPTSQYAVKEGDLNKMYDTRFVFSEVNADVVNYIVQSNGSVSKGNTLTSYVGKLICTKAVGKKSINNVTSEYKYAEGTAREREIYNKALGRTGFITLSAEGRSASRKQTHVSGGLIVSGSPMVGDDITVKLTLRNLTSKDKNVTANMSAFAIVYNKAVRKPIFKDSVAVPLRPSEEKEIPIQITYHDYDNKLTTDKMIQVIAVCQVENEEDLFIETSLTLQTPPIQIQALGQAILGSPTTVEITFTNPLSKPLTDCVLTAEGSGLIEHVILKNVGALEPEQKMSITVDINPYVTGEKQLLINLTSDKFNNIKGFITIDVADVSS
ncbi:protein-glutamine gamma-glutamyltransferase E-like [Bombina bombina]|uniref:protein-glutamine gamma-glutamyltransferase E-like n=1 Tax=Bombina bombina TaxID=8345 RepID=UPI00235AF3EC|nr:protein-glutamine gamma-glutamyltransferase E-like [Bombina bombina]